jgi:hypothetical protein
MNLEGLPEICTLACRRVWTSISLHMNFIIAENILIDESYIVFITRTYFKIHLGIITALYLTVLNMNWFSKL